MFIHVANLSKNSGLELLRLRRKLSLVGIDQLG